MGRHQRWTRIAGVVGLLLLAPAAWAETGEGAFDHGRFNILAWSKARPLKAIGDDVVRMSSTPALGGQGWVIELHRVDEKFARGEVRFLWTSRDRGEETGRIKLGMLIEDYEALTRRIDEQLTRRDFEDSRVVHNSKGQVTELIVCTDGPGYVTERRVGGKEVWLDGFCGDNHPNDAIAVLLQAAVMDYACGWMDRDRRCAAPPVEEAE